MALKSKGVTLEDVSKWLERFRRHGGERLEQLDDYLRELQEKGEER
jgi:hypothetical protein